MLIIRILITLCVGFAAILGWQSYGDAARQIIASSYPQAGSLAPRTVPIGYSAPGTTGLVAQAAPSLDQQRLNAISLDLDTMRQTVDRIAVTQEQITRKIEKLTADQERITREISRVQAIEQQKNAEPPPRSAPASAHKTLPRSAQAPTAR
jgi:carbamoylphosphate synthase small subunit